MGVRQKQRDVRTTIETVLLAGGVLLILAVAAAVMVVTEKMRGEEVLLETEASQHLLALHRAEAAHHESSGAYTGDLGALGLPSETEHFRYRVFPADDAYTAHALHKDLRRRPRRFMTVDQTGVLVKAGLEAERRLRQGPRSRQPKRSQPPSSEK